MLASLASDLLLIPLLERVPGRTVVRLSATASIFIYAAWLLAPWPLVKMVLLVAVRFSTIGWYQVLQGEAYAACPRAVGDGHGAHLGSRHIGWGTGLAGGLDGGSGRSAGSYGVVAARSAQPGAVCSKGHFKSIVIESINLWHRRTPCET